MKATLPNWLSSAAVALPRSSSRSTISTLAPALTKAHQNLDAAVDMAYAKRRFTGDSDRVAFLFELYQQITSPLESKKVTRRKRIKVRT